MNRKNVMGCVVGTLLGDSYIQKRGNSYRISSQNVSLDLILYKKMIFDLLAEKDNPVMTRPPRESGYLHGKYYMGKESYTVGTSTTKLGYIYRFGYVNGVKTVSRRLLDRLTPQGIALWYMDDGYYLYTESNGTRRMYFATDSFTEFEVKLMVRYFSEVWGIQSSVKWHKGSKEASPKPRLKFGGKDLQKMVVLMYPYILTPFLYKVNVLYKTESRLIPEFIETHRQLTARSMRKHEDIV